MKFNHLNKKGISVAVACVLVAGGALTYAGVSSNTNTKDKSVDTLNAGVSLALNAKEIESIDVTAGVSDALWDSSNVAVTGTGVAPVAQALEEDTAQAAAADEASEEVLTDEDVSEDTEKTVAELCGYTKLGMSNISEGNLNIRKKATTDSKIVGKMTKNNACEILGTKDDWTKIKSGSVTGYVKSEYLYTGEDANKAAEKAVITVATVNTTTLRVRKKASVDSSVVSLVGEGEDLTVEKIVDGWYKVEVDDEKGYISGDYVDISQKLPTASSIKELNESSSDGSSSTGSSLVQYALQFVGNRYVWGGTSLTGGIDCSGFTMQVYAHYGVSLPHHAASQPAYGRRVSSSEAKPGDLFFYSNGGGINHVAIYIGNGQVVHASNPRTGIKISNAFYRTPVCVVRYLN